jgi:peptidoglycan/LPS O-acetylase OafA/YrhL
LVQLSTQPDTESAAVKPSRLPTLTGLRFVAAIAVFVAHALLGAALFASNFQYEYIGLIFQGGWAAVVYFFVLSGFIMTWASRADDNPGTFWRRRAVRVFPNYLITLAAYIIVMAVAFDVVINGGQVVVHALLMQSFSPDLNYRIAFNPPAWSLSAEVFFYICFPLLIKIINKIRPERLWTWAGIVAASTFVVPLAAPALVPDTPVVDGFGWPVWEMWLVQQCPPVRMLEFIFGMILAKIVISGRKSPVNFPVAILIFVAVYAVSPWIPENLNMAAIQVVPIGLIIVAAAVKDRTKNPGWLGSKFMIKAGDISYAFYIWHFMILIYARMLLGTPEGWSAPVGWLVMAGLFVATAFVSWLQFKLVEDPLVRRFSTSKKRRTTKKPQPTPVA